MSENIRELTNKLATMLVSNNVFINDEVLSEVDYMLNHYIELHGITEYNLNRLIDGFIPIMLQHNTKEIDNCKYHYEQNTSVRCVLSYNWGKQKKFNTNNSNINSTVFKYFSSSILHYINGLTENRVVLPALLQKKVNNEKLMIVNGRAKLTRISTKHQMNELMKLETDEEQFDYLIASMNKEPKRIIEYLETMFTHEEIEEIFITPIKGKSKVATILFRVPLVARTIIRLFLENSNKEVWVYNNSQLIRLDLQQLIGLYNEGLLHTRKEKIDAYVTKLSYKRGHLTQLPIFAFGLFLLSPQQIIKEIELANKTLPTLEEVEKSRVNAKLCIVDYKESFMMTEQSIQHYKARVDEFFDLLTIYINDNEKQIRILEIDCKHQELSNTARYNEVVLKCKNYETCNYETN